MANKSRQKPGNACPCDHTERHNPNATTTEPAQTVRLHQNVSLQEEEALPPSPSATGQAKKLISKWETDLQREEAQQ